MRWIGLAAWSLGLTVLAGSPATGVPVRAEIARQVSTPAATPAVVVQTPAPAAPTAAPTLAPAAIPAPTAPPVPQTDVVTLVAWYANDPSGAFINVLPVRTDAALVAGPDPAAAAVGRVEFPDTGVPFIQLGDTRFDSYARTEGDIPERWTWFDDFEGARPATLVLQVAGTGGPYQGYFGTATFVSRDEGGAGGVLVLALRPPTTATDTGTAAAEPTAAAGAAAPADAADAGAVQPNPDIEPPTEALAGQGS